MHLYKQNWSGKIVDAYNLKPEDLNLDSMVLSLSRLYRFGGLTIVPYTVLDHTVIGTWVCEQLGYEPQICKDFLCHDLVEGVLGFDCPSPIKKQCPALQHLEHVVENVLMSCYGFGHSPEMKQVDYLMQYWEAFFLTVGGPEKNPEYWPQPDIKTPDLLTNMLYSIRDENCDLDSKKEFYSFAEKYGVVDA